MALTEMKCRPCEGGEPALSMEEAGALHRQVPEWRLRPGRLEREVRCKDFRQAMAFVNQVADLAEAEGHHPDIRIHGYRNVSMELTTHAIGGLSQNDFILAAKIDALLE